MATKTWQHYQEIVFQHLKRRFWGLEVVRKQDLKDGSKPDFVINNFWLVFTVVADAKHKGNITHDDIDKLARDGKVHHADWLHLYISTQSGLSQEAAEYAKRHGVEVYQLGWNGQEKRLV